MKVLYLDTSSKFLSLAVAEDKKVLSRIHRCLDRKHSTQLAALIDKLLKKANVPLKKIDGLCVSKGPGSFTGLRIGHTTIKALAYVLRKPVVAVPSLDILARNALSFKSKDGPVLVCPVIDAKQNKVYTCLYQMNGDRITRKSGYLLLSVENFLKRLKGKVLFLGDGILRYREEICADKKIKPCFCAEKLWYPKAAKAVPLALERFEKGNVDDAASLSPLYLYPDTCQIKNRRK
jgi:tRNA threonylcarbamoyladenosine biosynthesis protein TsaB